MDGCMFGHSPRSFAKFRWSFSLGRLSFLYYLTLAMTWPKQSFDCQSRSLRVTSTLPRFDEMSLLRGHRRRRPLSSLMTKRSNLNCKPHFGRTSFIREGRCRNYRRSAIFAAKNRCKGKLASQRPTTSHRLFRRDQANGEMHMSPIAAIAFETKNVETL